MSASHSSTDLSLIRHSLLNPSDLDAGSSFYRKYSAIIRGTLRHMCALRPDEEDIIQETLHRIISHFGRFNRKRRGAFRAWIRRVARSAVVEWYRKNPITPLVSPEVLADTVASSVAAEFELDLAQATVSAVRLEMSPLQWEMFDRLRLKGESAESIATIQGVTAFAVYKAAYRVGQRLREVRARLEGGV